MASSSSTSLPLHRIDRINPDGSYEFDRIIKRGTVLLRTKHSHLPTLTTWKQALLILRPTSLCFYKLLDSDTEGALLLAIPLTHITAVAPRLSLDIDRDEHLHLHPSVAYSHFGLGWRWRWRWDGCARCGRGSKKKYHVFGVFTPAKNQFVRAAGREEMVEWVDVIEGVRENANANAREGDQSIQDDNQVKHTKGGPAPAPGPSQSLRVERDPSTSTSSPTTNDFISASIHLTTHPHPHLPVSPTNHPERVLHSGHLALLHRSPAHLGRRRFRRLWLVLRAHSIAIYRDAREYRVLEIIEMGDVVGVAEIEPLSRGKGRGRRWCLQVITRGRTWRFAAGSEEERRGWVQGVRGVLVLGDGKRESFENIYLDLSRNPGKCKFAESGLGWRPAGGGDTFTLDRSNIGAAQWSRAARGYELKILSRTSGVIQLDGFDQENFDRLSKTFKIWYGINLEHREHALRGWNWGKAEFGKAELTFNVQNRPAFEIPYSEVSNTNLAGKTEVAVEFALPADGTVSTQPAGSTKNRGRKAAAGRDELVEMRFYIPGTVKKEDDKGEGEEGADGEGEGEEQSAASTFYETLLDKAEIGEIAGDTFATFLDVLHLTPRGRFDIDMYENSFRLRGKTYDYKIQFQSIKKFFLLPKNDDTHTLITLGLDPPLRQGQTRYPFLVMQLKLDEEISIDLNMTEDVLQSRYKDKLQPHYEEPIHQVITKVFRGLSGKKVVMPSKDFVSHHGHSGVKCSIKANEGLLFCLDKSFMFVPKPATYIQIENISVIKMSRVGGAISASRTFDITMTLKNGMGEHQFSNINREEQQPLEDFFKAKNIRFKNEMADDASTLIAAALDDDLASSGEDDNRGGDNSNDEDSESADEDFEAGSESEVAEEYDSQHESSGSDSEGEGAYQDDDGDADGDMDMDDAEEEEERPKKKSKTGK